MPARERVQNHKDQKETEKTQRNMACLRQPRVQSQVLPAGCHSTGGKGKYRRAGQGEGAHLPDPATPNPLGGLAVINGSGGFPKAPVSNRCAYYQQSKDDVSKNDTSPMQSGEAAFKSAR